MRQICPTAIGSCQVIQPGPPIKPGLKCTKKAYLNWYNTHRKRTGYNATYHQKTTSLFGWFPNNNDIIYWYRNIDRSSIQVKCDCVRDGDWLLPHTETIDCTQRRPPRCYTCAKRPRFSTNNCSEYTSKKSASSVLNDAYTRAWKMVDKNKINP